MQERILPRLLDLLEKEVKTPLNATGSFFDLVEEDHRGTAFGLEIASRAARQFQQTLTVLDTLLEWGIVHQLDRNRKLAGVDTHRLVRGLFARFKQCTCSRRFTLVDRHKDGGVLALPEAEIRFVMEMILYWLCEVAEDGEILVERLVLEGGVFKAGFRLQSGSLFSRLGQRVERVVNGKISSEGKACPAEGFYLALARDIVEEFGGELWVKMNASVIEAGFELNVEMR
ncbi:MAG TPA: hypothetical protein VHE34_04170 [Puia sp.]|uniref:hypothetical protein n=1 Tax=Puia sp. TaxID=2045100 RepID=UPI002BDC8FF9|nr:hypothetical protein [Puia sp.]HVU94391.1 hypothetical protein [Puia sp.]